MVRRPLMYMTIAFAAAIISGYYLEAWETFLPVLLFLALSFAGKAEKSRIAGLLAVGYVFGLLSFAWEQAAPDPFEGREEQVVMVEAEIVQTELRQSISNWGRESSFIHMKIDVKAVDGEEVPQKERILLNYYGGEKTDENNRDRHIEVLFKELIPGDIVMAEGIVKVPEGRRNPGCFDYALYLKSIGIRNIMTSDHLIVMDERGSKTLIGQLSMRKERFLGELEKKAGKETASLMRAVLFGEKTGLEEDTLEEFQKNGTAHVLAVSGLHVGIIYGFICLLWRWKKGYLFFGCVMLFFGCYTVMAGFSPSVVRAVCMVGLHIFAKVSGRRYDLSSAAFLIALIMLAKDPMQLFHAGFQMSFLAVLTLSLMLPIVKRVYSGIFLGSIAVQIGLTPYTVYTFNYLSITSVFINVPVIFLTGIIVPSGLCSMALMAFWEPAFEMVSSVLFGLCKIMTGVNALTGIDGITVFNVTSPDIGWIAAYYLSLLFFASEEGRLVILRHRKKMLAAMAVCVIVLSVLFGNAAGNKFKDADVVFVDVGQGDCIHFRTESGGNYLVDGGGSISYNVGKKTLKPYLLKNGADRLDGAFVTHLHTDHYKGIVELCREGMVERLFLYEGNRPKEKEILKETELEKENLIYLYKGQTVQLAEDAMVQVLWPERGTESRYLEMAAEDADENDSSLILQISVKNRDILATGDVDESCLDGLAEMWGAVLDTDILKVAHHGSKYSYSENFAAVAAPEYAVFQVGKNNFGHPDKGVVENYLGKGIIIYRNDENGAIAFTFSGERGVEVMTVKGEIP